MTEVSSTRLYLGNLPRNGELSPPLVLPQQRRGYGPFGASFWSAQLVAGSKSIVLTSL